MFLLKIEKGLRDEGEPYIAVKKKVEREEKAKKIKKSI